MATNLNVTNILRNHWPPRMQVGTWHIPSVNVSATSPRYRLEVLNYDGVLCYVRIAYPNVATIQLRIFASEAATLGSNAEILRVDMIESCWQHGYLGIPFRNLDPSTDDTRFSFIYAEVENQSATLATGEIELELHLESSGEGPNLV